VITQYEETLIRLPLVQWPAFFSEKQQEGQVADSASAIEFVRELESKYGAT
jgi:hypothetical protein